MVISAVYNSLDEDIKDVTKTLLNLGQINFQEADPNEVDSVGISENSIVWRDMEIADIEVSKILYFGLLNFQLLHVHRTLLLS